MLPFRTPTRKFRVFFSKLRTDVYPSNKARIGVKLWQNAFQTICNFSFFDVEKKWWKKNLRNIFGINNFFKKVTFWMSYEFLIRVGRCVVKSYCPNSLYFWGDFLGEGVNDSICVENLNLAPRMTSTIWCCDWMMIWEYDLSLIHIWRCRRRG